MRGTKGSELELDRLELVAITGDITGFRELRNTMSLKLFPVMADALFENLLAN